MNIQQLKYFIEISNTRNVSLAAKNLFVTQPTLSLSLKKLETELGTALFKHTDQPFQLTDAGRHLYENGLEIVQQFEQVIVDIQTMSECKKKAKIRLGLTTLFSVQFMPEISAFLSANPHVELAIRQDGSPRLQEMLVNKELDIGLISFPNNHPESLAMEALETTTQGYHVYVVLPNHHPLATAKELTFKDLKGERFSSLSEKFMIGRLLRSRTREFGYEPDIVLENDDLQVLIHSVHDNHSICLLPIEYQAVGKSEHVTWVPLKDKFAYFPIGIAFRKGFSLSKEISDFIDTIKKN